MKDFPAEQLLMKISNADFREFHIIRGKFYSMYKKGLFMAVSAVCRKREASGREVKRRQSHNLLYPHKAKSRGLYPLKPLFR
jgi:hypothetical protein